MPLTVLFSLSLTGTVQFVMKFSCFKTKVIKKEKRSKRNQVKTDIGNKVNKCIVK